MRKHVHALFPPAVTMVVYISQPDVEHHRNADHLTRQVSQLSAHEMQASKPPDVVLGKTEYESVTTAVDHLSERLVKAVYIYAFVDARPATCAPICPVKYLVGSSTMDHCSNAMHRRRGRPSVLHFLMWIS